MKQKGKKGHVVEQPPASIGHRQPSTHGLVNGQDSNEQTMRQTIPMPMSNASCFGGGSIFQAMIRPSPTLHGFMPDNSYGAMQAGSSNPMYGNIGVQPGFQCAAGSYGMLGANMGMAGFSQPDAQNLIMAGRPGGNFGSGMPLLNAPAYDNLMPKGKPKDYKEGGQAVKFDTFHGTHDIKSFLGLCSYYRRFIRHFAEIPSPLHALTHKGVTFKWTTKKITAFKHLKEKLTSDPVIILPNLLKPFVVQCDACGYSLGAVLMQDGRVVAYESKAPFEIVEGGKKVPPILQTKDKIFEADKYVQNTDEAYRKTQSKQKKAADRHRHELVFSLGDWVLLRFEKARLRKMKGKERLFPELGMHYYGPFKGKLSEEVSPTWEFCWGKIWGCYVANILPEQSLDIDFSVQYLPSKIQEVALLDTSGKSWFARWLGARNGLSGGWRKFSLDHGLEEGDICVFELLDSKKVVIKVHIFRVVPLRNEMPGRDHYLHIPQGKASCGYSFRKPTPSCSRCKGVQSSGVVKKMRGAIASKNIAEEDTLCVRTAPTRETKRNNLRLHHLGRGVARQFEPLFERSKKPLPQPAPKLASTPREVTCDPNAVVQIKKYYMVERLFNRRKGIEEEEFLVELESNETCAPSSSRVKKEGSAWWIPLSHFTKDKMSCHL
ncbi:hypothetical protein L7F22_064717 [Adiantum nelumboides]|nr:hypothetical protein [Adiantum nelumboides]